MTNISVIIPTLGRKSLKKCLKSVLSQDKKPAEIIIIDNSPKYSGNEIISEFSLEEQKQLKYISEKNKGAAVARNRGIIEAKSQFLCFLDDDCEAETNWLSNLYDSFIKNNKKAVIKGENTNGNSNNIFSCLEYYTDELFFKKEFFINRGKIESFWLDTKNFMISKNLIVKKHLHFNKHKISEDLDFSLQLKMCSIHIYYADKAIIKHYGRNNLFDHLKREIYKIIDSEIINKKWLEDNKKKAILKEIMQQNYLRKKWQSDPNIQKDLIEKILDYKPLYFKVIFYLSLVINQLIINIFKILFFFYQQK